MTTADTATLLNALAADIHAIARDKGWYDGYGRNPLELICLVHSELSEAVESERNHRPRSEKLPEVNQTEEELADAVIRILDLCAYLCLDIGKAVAAKIEYNKTRPYRHGGKLY